MSALPRAYQNSGFLDSKDARALRILVEYLEPKSRFDHHRVDDTIVFKGSTRIKSREVIDFNALARHGTVTTEDIEPVHRTDF